MTSESVSAESAAYVPVLKLVSENKCFGGTVYKFTHTSLTLHCEMKLSVFLPRDSALASPDPKRVPALFFLSGLTCNEDNFITKAGAIRTAANLKLALICPDTSPRAVPIEGDSDSWDFGVGAGFYVNATEDKWSKHYNMYDYVAKELPIIVAKELPVDEQKFGISGHSMGGHGALVIGLRENRLFKSISAFAPICEPSQCAWGQKAFSGYLGAENKEAWLQYDACALLRNYTGANASRVDILVDQGTEDKFLKDGQLRTDALKAVSALPNNASIVIRMQHGYDHSYWFIQSFIDYHLEFHAERLNAEPILGTQQEE